MDEQEFLDAIDCRFPYSDEVRWRALVDQAVRISPNAAFAVLDEISRPLRSATVSSTDRQAMVAYWRAANDHSLADIACECALARIAGQGLSEGRVLDVMSRVAEFPDQYAALSVVYFAVEEASDAVDQRWDEITSSWGRVADGRHSRS